MGWGSSTRRRCLRLQTSVSRKLSVTRWISGVTVGVINMSIRINAHDQSAKASEGAEKSFRLRRSRRGQRVGKSRSRGRQPRSPQNHPAPLGRKGDRLVRHSGRKLIWLVVTRNKLEKFMRSGNGKRPGEGDHRYEDGRRRFRALSRRATMMGVPVGAFEHPGNSFLKFLNSLWPTEQAFTDLLSMVRHVGREVRATPSSRTEPAGDIWTVIIDGEEDYLCSFCSTDPIYDRRGSKVSLGRRVCNINLDGCLLGKKADREQRSSSLRRSSAKRVPRGRARRRA